MHVYFSHSYRDVAVNSYFLEHLVQQEVPLVADQKSETWCVAKLERYLFETSGFISIIPKRASDKDLAGYSAYIGHELDLARRARVPRLLFVDREVLQHNETRFPQDAIAFDATEPERDAAHHREAIAKFRDAARAAVAPLRAVRRRDHATLIVDTLAALRPASHEVAELLRREGFAVTQLSPARAVGAMDNIRLLEDMWRSELCVFLLGPRLSEAHLALAMAHAHCVPAVRLVWDKVVADPSPTLAGAIRWNSQEAMLVEFRKQLSSFRRGLVEPVAMAQSATVEEVARTLGTTEWQAGDDQLWQMADGPGLMRHVATADPMVQDEVDRVRKQLRSTFDGGTGRERDYKICCALYDSFKRHKYAYEMEPHVGSRSGWQKIRSPALIAQSSAATCIDLACLFSALLEAAGLNPVIVVVSTLSMRHAVVGYRAAHEPPFPRNASLGELRRALQAGDALLFEATGTVEADSPVTPEEDAERRDKLLDFLSAKATALRLLARHDVSLVHCVDVRALRV